MKLFTKYRNYTALAAAALIIVIDQLLKLWVSAVLKPIITFPVIEDILHFTYIENRGMAFSMLEGKQLFLSIFTAVMLLIMIFLLAAKKIKNPMLVWSVAAIIGGGIGNLIDRIFRGFVIDYVDFRIINFAVFNFADCCIVIGTILVVVNILFFNSSINDDKGKTEETGEVIQDVAER